MRQILHWRDASGTRIERQLKSGIANSLHDHCHADAAAGFHRAGVLTAQCGTYGELFVGRFAVVAPTGLKVDGREHALLRMAFLEIDKAKDHQPADKVLQKYFAVELARMGRAAGVY